MIGTFYKLFQRLWTRWSADHLRDGRLWGDSQFPLSNYALFISYRHIEPDRMWAKWLHGALETYSVPELLVREHRLPQHIGRVFRDEEELAASPNLSKEIQQALDRSDYLLVICSPRTPQSKWVNAEVDYFRAIGRNDRILALLIEGEPAEAFPKSLCEIRRSLTDRDNVPHEDIETLEPLAADVRLIQGESVRHRKRMALMRLLAPILGCRFDDLRQREQERQTRRLKNWAIVTTVMVAILTSLSIYAEINRRLAIRQRDHALEAQSYLLSDLSQQSTGRGDARIGILLALEALPKNYSAPDRPYVAAAESALYQALVIPREVGVLRGHQDIVRQVSFSPDGHRVLTASHDHTARLWDAATFKPVAILQGDKDIIMHAAFSPDGKCIVTASSDGTARLWSSTDGTEIFILSLHKGPVISAAFSRDSTLVATASRDRTARIWDVESGTALAVLQGHTGPLSSIEFSHDGTQVVTSSEDGTARLWNAASGSKRVILRGHVKKVNRAAFSPDGTRVVTASDDGTARLWKTDNGRSLILRGHTKAVLHAVFSPDGKRIATASDDGTARLWDANKGTEIAVLTTGESVVNHVEFSPDSRRLITSSGVLDLGSSTARLWDAATGAETAILRGHEGMLLQAAFNPDGNRVVTASYDGTARLWTTNGSLKIPGITEDCRIENPSVSRETISMTTGAHPSGQTMVPNHQGKADGKTREFHQIAEALNPIDELWGKDGQLIKVIGLPEGRPPTLVDFANHTITELKGHTDEVYSAAFSPDGSRIITASADHTARLWEAADGTPIIVLKGHGDAVWSAAFSPDGTRAVTASQDQTARLWAADGTPLNVLKGHDAGVVHAAFSPHGDQIVTSSWDGSARIWDASTGTTLQILRGHTDKVIHATFSPDGRRIGTASFDGTSRLWDVGSGQEIAVLPGPDRFVRNASFNKVGDRITIFGSAASQRCFQIFRNTQALVDFARSLPAEKLSTRERKRYWLEQPEQ